LKFRKPLWFYWWR